MGNPVLFIQGGGEGAFEADRKLAASLRNHLGPGHVVRYPQMPDEDEADYEAWTRAIADELAALGDGAVLVGHSIGGSVVLRAVVDGRVGKGLAGLFAVSAPFWHDHDFWRWPEASLPDDAAARIPAGLPLFLYHGLADEFVPVSHVDMYAGALPQAVVRRLEGRNHQLNDDLGAVARDIVALV